MNYLGIKSRYFCFYLKLPMFNRRRLEFYEFIICVGNIFIGINWAWHTGRGLFICTNHFFLKWAWSGIADDYSKSKSKFQFWRKSST